MAMHFIERLRYILLGKANAVVEGLENPEEQLVVIVDELDDQLRELQRSVAIALADEKRLRREIEEHLARASEWEKRALLALNEGDENLAREALAKKEDSETLALKMQQRWETQKAATEKLKTSLQRAKERVAEARRQHTLLIAQYKSAQATQRIQESLATPTAESSLAIMDRLAERIRRIEAETDANFELDAEATDGEIEDRFVEIERRTRGDQALDALKGRLASMPPPAPDRQADRLDALKSKLGQG